MSTPCYITTPLYYVNDELHIGHATTTIYADTFARFWRMDGRDVCFLTGSDEHGQKIFKAARNKGCTPKELADQIVGKFREVWQALGIQYDIFIRTTDAYHIRTVKSLFSRLTERGLVYKGVYKALYCTDCEQAYSPSMLEEGRCPIHNTIPAEIDEENYFFKLSAFTNLLRLRLDDERLNDLEREEAKSFARDLGITITPDADAIQPAAKRNEILGKLREGLEDTSISRTAFDWGVSMPGDPDHVIWVWFDALINYVSALTREACEASSAEVPPLADLLKSPNFARYWPSTTHIIGKDILWHHSVVWWSMLAAAGIQPPQRVFAHGWWSVEGRKMGKTLGNVIRPVETAQAFSCDALRYYILREGPAKNDANWQQERFIGRINADLAGGLGNLLSRVLGMNAKYFDGHVPAAGDAVAGSLELEELAAKLAAKLRKAVCAFDGDEALEAIWLLVRAANKYVDETQPFKLAKDEARRGELATVMHTLLQTLRVLAHVLTPFLPDTAAGMKDQLGIAAETVSLDEAVKWSPSFVGTATTKGGNLFPRIEDVQRTSNP